MGTAGSAAEWLCLHDTRSRCSDGAQRMQPNAARASLRCLQPPRFTRSTLLLDMPPSLSLEHTLRTLNTSRRPVVLNVALPGAAAAPLVFVLPLGSRVTANANGSELCSNANCRSPSGGGLPAQPQRWRVAQPYEFQASGKVPAMPACQRRPAGAAASSSGQQHQQQGLLKFSHPAHLLAASPLQKAGQAPPSAAPWRWHPES